MKAVKIATLKDTLSKTLRAVQRGDSIVVTDRSRPVAMLMPLEDENGVTLISRTRPFSTIRNKKYPGTQRHMDSLALLLLERGKR
jgi:prevent-host-death family protein